MTKMEGGRKADLIELLRNTIPKILAKKKWEVDSNRTLNVRCTIGMDGGG